MIGEFGLEFVDQRRRKIPNEDDKNAIFGRYNGAHFCDCQCGLRSSGEAVFLRGAKRDED